MKVVQIGSNKGNDDLNNYLKNNFNHIDFGLFIEVNPIHIDDLKKSYSNFSNVNVECIAIKSPLSNTDRLEIFYNTNDGPGYEIASCDIEHVKKHMNIPNLSEGEIRSFIVDCFTLEDILDKYQIIDLDWLLLDIEGIDAEVLLTFNWGKYNIKRIEFEYIHLGQYSYNIESMMRGMGYRRIEPLHVYDWAFIKQ